MKMKVNWIILVVFLFIILLIIGFLTIKKPAYSYKMTSKEISDIYLQNAESISPEQFVKNSTGGAYLLIDVRQPSEFVKGHFDNALNIPFPDLLSDEYKEVLNNQKLKLIYAENESIALQAWMILRQIGYVKINYLKGGFFATNCVIHSDSNFNIRRTSDENLLYNFSDVSQPVSASNETDVKPEKKPVKVAPRKSQPSGGC